VGLTQVVIWVLGGVAAINLLMRANPELNMGGLITPSYFWLMIGTFIPSFIMVAALMAPSAPR